MKHLELQNIEHIQLRESFEQWLKALGYSKQTVYNLPNHINEFLWWCETNNIFFNNITQHQIESYHSYLSTRTNERRSGGLSINQLKKHRQALQKFSEYMVKTRGVVIPVFHIQQQPTTPIVEYLSELEIIKLYAGIDNTLLGKRDKAILSMLYGCGLRRNEAYHLNTDDINTENRTVHIKHGKGYKERIVPIIGKCYQDLEEYLITTRPRLNIKKNKALILTERGTRMTGQAMQLRLNKMCGEANVKKIGLHGLRHSIATHLLNNGMKLERVSEFLGHNSIESTQIYTHLIQEDHE